MQFQSGPIPHDPPAWRESRHARKVPSKSITPFQRRPNCFGIGIGRIGIIEIHRHAKSFQALDSAHATPLQRCPDCTPLGLEELGEPTLPRHATPRHRAHPSESLQPGLPPAVDARTSEKTELEIKVKLRNPESNSKITQHCNSGLPPIVDVSTTEEKWQGSNCVTRARISNKV